MFDKHLDAFENCNAGCEVHLMLHLYEYLELNYSMFCNKRMRIIVYVCSYFDGIVSSSVLVVVCSYFEFLYKTTKHKLVTTCTITGLKSAILT